MGNAGSQRRCIGLFARFGQFTLQAFTFTNIGQVTQPDALAALMNGCKLAFHLNRLLAAGQQAHITLLHILIPITAQAAGKCLPVFINDQLCSRPADNILRHIGNQRCHRRIGKKDRGMLLILIISECRMWVRRNHARSRSLRLQPRPHCGFGLVNNAVGIMRDIQNADQLGDKPDPIHGQAKLEYRQQADADHCDHGQHLAIEQHFAAVAEAVPDNRTQQQHIGDTHMSAIGPHGQHNQHIVDYRHQQQSRQRIGPPPYPVQGIKINQQIQWNRERQKRENGIKIRPVYRDIQRKHNAQHKANPCLLGLRGNECSPGRQQAGINECIKRHHSEPA